MFLNNWRWPGDGCKVRRRPYSYLCRNLKIEFSRDWTKQISQEINKPISVHLLPHIKPNILFPAFLIEIIFTGMRCYTIVILIYISQPIIFEKLSVNLFTISWEVVFLLTFFFFNYFYWVLECLIDLLY